MTAGTNLGWRITGIIALALFVAAVMATLIFPIVAGVTNLGMAAGVTKFASLSAWVGYALGNKTQPAHWSVFWFHFRNYLAGTYAVAPAYTKAVTVTLAVAGAVGLLSALGVVYRLWLGRPAQPLVTRRHMRGTTLVARTDMPAFTAALIAHALNPADERKRRRDAA